MPQRTSQRVAPFTESVIREMTRLAIRHNAVNLAQGFPDFPAPEIVKQAACQAILEDVNQYAITWGAPALRRAISDKYRRHYGLEIDPETEITVVCGSTEGMIASLLATVDPGDEIVIFEPWYENYGPDAWLSGASRRYVRLRPPDWSFDPAGLKAAFTPRTRAVILNSPHNPTGKVFSREELEQIAALCRERDVLCISDEIYEHILYDGAEHLPVMTFDGMRERSILVNSMSKTWSVTGWRVGWVIAPPEITAAVRKVHDFLTVGAAAPLQQAAVAALSMPDSYFEELSRHYAARRDYLLKILDDVGFETYRPRGAYYVMAGFAKFGIDEDIAMSLHLIEMAGVAVVPGSSFFDDRKSGSGLVRFCFCKNYETLEEAGTRLRSLHPR